MINSGSELLADGFLSATTFMPIPTFLSIVPVRELIDSAIKVGRHEAIIFGMDAPNSGSRQGTSERLGMGWN
jgi:hypothetical protein